MERGEPFLLGATGTSFGRRMILHACDGCGAAIRPGTRFNETVCGDCAQDGLPTTAHTVCEMCSDRGVDLVRLALEHQVAAHELPAAALEAKPVALWPWGIGSRPERAESFGAQRPLVAA
jgi:hypothetical protein